MKNIILYQSSIDAIVDYSFLLIEIVFSMDGERLYLHETPLFFCRSQSTFAISFTPTLIIGLRTLIIVSNLKNICEPITTVAEHVITELPTFCK